MKKNTWKKICRIGLIGASVLFFALVCTVIYAFVSAPKLSDLRLQDLDQSLMLYDKNDDLIQSLDGGQDRVLCEIETLSDTTIHAFLCAEDLRFYRHIGIDPRRILGALVSNFKSGSYAEGASTITQQLVKLSHLSGEKTIRRKLQEMALALVLEHRYEKDEILEMYLNTVYFGCGYYGIEAAAQGYFGIPARELAPWQAAALAATLKSPAVYAPYPDGDACKNRRDLILTIMAQEGFLSTEEALQQKGQNMAIRDQSARENLYGWYVDAVLLEATQKLNVNLDELYSGGYRIYTCADQNLQTAMEQLFSNEAIYPPAAPNGELCQSAALVMDASGGIVSLIGGRTYEGALTFNRATDALRQPGSLIKPFADYAPALEAGGMSAVSFILDEPTDFDGYAPQNYGGNFAGQMLLCDALAQSQNVPAVKLLDQVGINVGYAYALRAGFALDERDRTLSLALGGLTHGVTPLQVCSAYAALAAQGIYHEPYFIRTITDAKGNLLYEHKAHTRLFISEQSAYELSQMLHYTVQTGTAAALQNVPAPLCAKTGTVDYRGLGNSDIWAAAYDPNYAAVVWMGMDETSAHSYLPSIATGGNQPTKALAEIFRFIYPEGSNDTFPMPQGVEEIQIDLTSSFLCAQPLLATEHTPENDRLTAYVKTEHIPQSAGTYWTPPAPPKDLRVQFDALGVPRITFTMDVPHAVYEIWREDARTGDICIATLDGSHKHADFFDVTAPIGTALSYRVRAVHKQSGDSGAFSQSIQTIRSPFFSSLFS